MSTANMSVGPRVYNLFPLLVGPLPQWKSHLERAQRMGFDWVFINAFHYAGYSGSLYSVKDYYAIDPRLIDTAAGPAMDQLKRMIKHANQLGLRLVMDLIINHTAFDSPLATEHPDWYKHDADGKPLRPSAKDGDKKVTWGDLAEIDNANSPDRAQLWHYWLQLAEHYATLGFQGFRCDAAYKVPGELWQFLIGHIKKSHPGTLFVAESLGCPFEDTVRLAQSGFDYILNSSKWWDFVAPWCLEQYRQTAPLVPSISFAESHDTERLAAELHGDTEAVKQRYAFSAFFSTGVMMPIGFEYGFRKRLDVVNTQPQDWETPQWDISEFIASVNRLKHAYRVFNEEGPIEVVLISNPQIFALVKSTRDRKERALIVLNKDRQHPQPCPLVQLGHVFSGMNQVSDISPDGQLQHTPDFQTSHFKPSGFHVIYGRQ